MADAGALDIEDPTALARYLRETARVGPDEPLEVRTLAGGVSNKTVLVVRSATGEGWVLKQALPKLRTKADWYSDPARIRREALALRWLPQLAPAATITPLVFEDEKHFLLAMRAVPQPHENWKSMLLAGRVDADHIRQFGALLGQIHRRAYDRRDEVAELFGDRSFFESLRLEPYYAYAAAQVPAAAAFLHDLIEQTRRRQLTLVHGDYSPKNVLVRQGQLILLDHEVIHFGDPAFDLGFGLTHLLSKANHLEGTPAEVELCYGSFQFWVHYSMPVHDLPWFADLETWAVRHTLGCLLARVAGRSPLEYLTEVQRARQLRAVLALIADPPENVVKLGRRFIAFCEEQS